jgi:hypothetical protein
MACVGTRVRLLIPKSTASMRVYTALDIPAYSFLHPRHATIHDPWTGHPTTEAKRDEQRATKETKLGGGESGSLGRKPRSAMSSCRRGKKGQAAHGVALGCFRRSRAAFNVYALRVYIWHGDACLYDGSLFYCACASWYVVCAVGAISWDEEMIFSRYM